ncbi:MAG TPA: LD-carboxypeptidase [Magnetospirillum sp.]|nr:LD-carboxypeptidase [Magnetospirillum sp.]
MAEGSRVKIGVVAPSNRVDPSLPDRLALLTASIAPDLRPEIWFHPQCFQSCGHFAGSDAARAQAFLEVANDESFDALWFGRGGYGSFRLAETVLAGLTAAAGRKTYLGYSDAGAMLGALYGAGVGRVAHGPMPADLNRANGEAAVRRALDFLTGGNAAALEPHVTGDHPTAAFNITILSHLIGTPYLPDLRGHVLMLEEVSEAMYRIDRALGQITSTPAIRQVAGIMLGRCGDVPPNDPDFGQSEDEVARYWCDRAGIPYLGRADIGHDVDNKVVPFGLWRP